MNYKTLSQIICGFLIILFTGCYSDDKLIETEDNLKVIATDYKTENVIVVVIDGPRQSETWQSVDRKYIPKQDKELAPKGVVISEFYNEGITLTVPGHVAITTGKYETIGNKGEQVPTEPSFLQLWLKISNAAKDKAWIVTSKDKLNVLANCNKLQWRNAYNPSVDAVFREDVKTFDAAKEILQKHNPRLMLLHFRGPDSAGHAGDWDDYVQNIAIADSLLYELWNFIETDEFYANKTTMLMTNDHGRHLDGIAGGFLKHGDHCIGCTHLNFYAYGPDFKKNVISNVKREQTNILPTVAELMGFKLEGSQEVMWELFK